MMLVCWCLFVGFFALLVGDVCNEFIFFLLVFVLCVCALCVCVCVCVCLGKSISDCFLNACNNLLHTFFCRFLFKKLFHSFRCGTKFDSAIHFALKLVHIWKFMASFQHMLPTDTSVSVGNLLFASLTHWSWPTLLIPGVSDLGSLTNVPC